MITAPAMMNGNKKWKEKNLVRVALPTEYPPHNQKTIWSPTYGMAEKKLVITVAPQKDIWPQGNTYSVKAMPMIKYQQAKPLQ